MNFSIEPDDILCFSIIVTGRCNATCSYCHFYKRHNRQEVALDVSIEVFDLYLQFISFIKEEYHDNVQVRFSGGEPLLLGDGLFELSRRVHDVLGIKPYILTNGKNLESILTNKSIQNNISAYLVSLENPFEINNGAVNTFVSVEKIKKYNDGAIAIKPGIVIVRNHMFSMLCDICDFFYTQLQIIPPVSELNFIDFEPPTDTELKDLEHNVYAVVKKYFGKSELHLFSYIVPELSNCYQNRYLVELDLTNKLGIKLSQIKTQGVSILNKYLNAAYPYSRCLEKDCDWHPYCRRVKWIWKNRIDHYCKMKKCISNAYHDALTEVFL